MRPVTALAFVILTFDPAVAADYSALPVGQGRDVMVRVCSQCHSPELTATRKMDQSGWKALVDQMASNGAQATDAEFDTITKYLAISFPAAKAAEPSPRSGADLSGAVSAGAHRNSPVTSAAPRVSDTQQLAVGQRTLPHSKSKSRGTRRLPDTTAAGRQMQSHPRAAAVR